MLILNDFIFSGHGLRCLASGRVAENMGSQRAIFIDKSASEKKSKSVSPCHIRAFVRAAGNKKGQLLSTFCLGEGVDLWLLVGRRELNFNNNYLI